jgi:hypothetical protein
MPPYQQHPMPPHMQAQQQQQQPQQPPSPYSPNQPNGAQAGGRGAGKQQANGPRGPGIKTVS